MPNLPALIARGVAEVGQHRDDVLRGHPDAEQRPRRIDQARELERGVRGELAQLLHERLRLLRRPQQGVETDLRLLHRSGGRQADLDGAHTNGGQAQPDAEGAFLDLRPEFIPPGIGFLCRLANLVRGLRNLRQGRGRAVPGEDVERHLTVSHGYPPPVAVVRPCGRSRRRGR
jgi:hypothetical protein